MLMYNDDSSSSSSSDFDTMDFDTFFSDIKYDPNLLGESEFYEFQNNLAVQSQMLSDVTDYTYSDDTSTENGSRKSKKQKLSSKAAREADFQHAYQPMLATLPNDIRRQYSLMFTNSLNSNDFSLFLAFLTKYSSPEFAYCQTYQGQSVDNNFRHPRLVQLKGLHCAAQYWFNKLQLIPDVVYDLLDTNVHTYSNSECSKITADMTARATFLYDVGHGAVVYMGSPVDPATEFLIDEHDHEIGDKKHFLLEEQEHALTLESASPDLNHNVDMASINTKEIGRYLSASKLTSPPVQCYCDIRLVMHLDANKALQRMEFSTSPRKDVRKKIVIYN